MARFGLLLLCLALLLPITGASAQGQYVAIVFECGDSPAAALELEKQLQSRGAKITLLLSGTEEVGTEQMGELGLLCLPGWNGLTRLQVAQQLKQLRQSLPEKAKVRWLSPQGEYSDAVRQVAGAMGYSFLGPSKRASVEPGAASLANQIRSGDVIYMGKLNPATVALAVEMMDILESRGFQAVTVSELACRQRIHLTPGSYYNTFRRRQPA